MAFEFKIEIQLGLSFILVDIFLSLDANQIERLDSIIAETIKSV